MNTTFQPTLEEFKQLAKEFFDNLKTVKNIKQIQGGLHCLGCNYVGLQTDNKLDQYQASIIFELASKKANEKELELLFAPFKS